MKKILIIAPNSYPVIGAEGIVNIKLIRALSNSGKFKIDLISREHPMKNYPNKQSLEEMGIKINSLHIVKFIRKMTLKTIYYNIASFFLFKLWFRGIHWTWQVLPIIKELIKNNDYDYVLTKDYPSFLLGNYIKQRYKLKWIATWNDPYPNCMYPKPYGPWPDTKLSFMSKRMVNVMKQADKHIFPSKRLMNHLCNNLGLNRSNSVVIPHVVLNNQIEQETKLKHDTLKIISSGNIKFPRNPETTFRALQKFLTTHPKAKIELSILGCIDENSERLIKKLNLNNFIKILPAVTYDESLEILKDYDVCLIIEADMKEGIYLPTKVSDFMQCKKHIWAISPQIGVLNDLYQAGYVQYFSNVANINDIYKLTVELYNDFTNNTLHNKQLNIPINFTEQNIVNQYYCF